MNKQFRRRHRRRGCEGERVNGGERGHGAVGDAVGEGAEADHHEDFDAVVLEDRGEGFEALVFADETVDVFREDGAAGEEGAVGSDYVGAGADEPPFHAVDEAGDGEGGGVADHGREGGDEDEGEADEPPPGESAPFHGYGGECGEERLGVHDEEDTDCGEEDVSANEEDALGECCGGPEREGLVL
ncbi:hypothetical protein V501_09198 [Pseudogymnoascus sp. VKM F-4519 (FW-2642)]|nr:hypothetical protein V501_09198 [Pseudogymnoascus sp. VKM F-4519 (FW-2642)]